MAVTGVENQSLVREFAPGIMWLDSEGHHINAHGGGVLYHAGVYYWFGEFKTAGKEGNRAQVGVSVYTSTDLYNWTNAGITLAVSDDPQHDLARGCILERPKVIFNPTTKQFVMWFHLELLGQMYRAARVGIATSDSPTGPFQFIRSFRLNAGHWPINAAPDQRQPLTSDEAARVSDGFSGGIGAAVQEAVPLLHRRDFAGGQMSRDMTLFVDDDGTAYHIAASEENATLHISRLADDFLDTTGEYVRVFPGGFHEAPALFKHRGQYFMISSHCTGWTPNPARLSMAPSVMGPWTELGNPCIGDAAAIATTFDSQSTYILPVAGLKDAFIFIADRWLPENAMDGRYVWLPIEFGDEGRPALEWRDHWNLSVFSR